MQVNVETRMDIPASEAEVWSILVDFGRHPEWNPFIRSIQGRPIEGARLRVSVQAPGGRSMSFRPRVTAVRPQRELRWLGQLLLPGLFDGEHYFRLEPAGPRCTRLVHGETFSGLLVRFGKNSWLEPTRRGFESMNEALKTRAIRA